MGNIIDRVVISANCTVEADIAVADKPYDFVQMTDHCAIIATIFMKSPENAYGIPNIPTERAGEIHHPRIKYLSKRDTAKFETYKHRVDERIMERGLAQQPVTSDMSFLQRYDELTDIIVETAKEVFSVTRKLDIDEKKISSPSICRLEKRLRHIGSALNLEKRGPLALVSEES